MAENSTSLAEDVTTFCITCNIECKSENGYYAHTTGMAHILKAAAQGKVEKTEEDTNPDRNTTAKPKVSNASRDNSRGKSIDHKRGRGGSRNAARFEQESILSPPNKDTNDKYGDFDFGEDDEPAKDNGGFHHPRDNGGFHHPRDKGGFHHPRDNGGFHHPRDNDGFHHPRDYGGFHHPRDYGEFHHPRDELHHPRDEFQYPRDEFQYPRGRGNFRRGGDFRRGGGLRHNVKKERSHNEKHDHERNSDRNKRGQKRTQSISDKDDEVVQDTGEVNYWVGRAKSKKHGGIQKMRGFGPRPTFSGIHQDTGFISAPWQNELGRRPVSDMYGSMVGGLKHVDSSSTQKKVKKVKKQGLHGGSENYCEACQIDCKTEQAFFNHTLGMMHIMKAQAAGLVDTDDGDSSSEEELMNTSTGEKVKPLCSAGASCLKQAEFDHLIKFTHSTDSSKGDFLQTVSQISTMEYDENALPVVQEENISTVSMNIADLMIPNFSDDVKLHEVPELNYILKRFPREDIEKGVFPCEICIKVLSNEDCLHGHITTKEHIKKKKISEMGGITYFTDGYLTQPLDKTCVCQKELDEHIDHAIVGLEYLYEVHPCEEDRDVYHVCMICCVSHFGDVIKHLTNRDHRMAYFRKHYVEYRNILAKNNEPKPADTHYIWFLRRFMLGLGRHIIRKCIDDKTIDTFYCDLKKTTEITHLLRSMARTLDRCYPRFPVNVCEEIPGSKGYSKSAHSEITGVESSLKPLDRWKARRLIVNNLPPGVKAQEVQQFFNINLIDKPVHGFEYNEERHNGYLVLRDMMECTKALILDGIFFNGHHLHLSRPKGFTPPEEYSDPVKLLKDLLIVPREVLLTNCRMPSWCNNPRQSQKLFVGNLSCKFKPSDLTDFLIKVC